MKNIINIVIDAFCYNNLERKVGKEEVTPFLNKLAKNSITFSNMYSQAPYTEASLIALLGGENTLENGGYLFGNANTKKSVMKDYKQAGYKTIIGYSPYVCSKAYLKGVTDYKYTRLFSIQPCFDYRLNYFREKKTLNQYIPEYYDVCILILDEAFDAWILQCDSIIKNDVSVEMIRLFIRDIELVKMVRTELQNQYSLYKKNKNEYVDNIFTQWKQHKLIELNKIYNNQKNFPTLKDLQSKYNLLLEKYQKTYEDYVLKKLHIDFNYIIKMFFSHKDKKDSLRTLKAYYQFKKNKNLLNYLNTLTSESKCEVSLHVMLNSFYENILECDSRNENYYVYFQPQEFHLPSLFHSFDIEDISVLDKEFEIAFSLLNELDKTYKGNILADLSARLCDYKIEEFYNKLKKTLKNDFIFVVMADHGYPSYYNPPRPFIYNQTYKEAFHIPFIINDSSNCYKNYEGIFSVLDGIDLVKQIAGIKEKTDLIDRNYVITEYAGPGCPMINEKKIWYTIISRSTKLSAEVLLGAQATSNDIINIYDIKNDPLQKKNLRLCKKRKNEIEDLLKKITERSMYLGNKIKCKSYLKDMINNANFD